jgi:serine O-acetyltransferase
MVFLIRLGQDLYRVPFVGKILGFIVEYLIRVIFASDISCRAKIGEGLVILHGHDIVIGADVIIGKGCKIFNGVTLGNKDINQLSLDNQPIVGNSVTLCTGSKILGNVTLADNVVVAANSVVLKNFPENVVVAGVPAKIIKNNE